jgi:uncharacterized protein (DUF433 family)
VARCNEPSYFNTGIYTLRDAARLTRVSKGRIRRWLRGYQYRWHSKSYTSPPLWREQWEPIDHSPVLGFLDLIEIRFVDVFLQQGVTWAMLRRARERAQELFKISHPFCSRRFATDGREIFVELHRETGEPSILEIVRRQQVFGQTLKPLLHDLEIDDELVVRWRPLGKSRSIVLDPTRNLGHPIVIEGGVPTEVLLAAAAVCPVHEVSRWYEVPEAEIRDAIEYEQHLAA